MIATINRPPFFREKSPVTIINKKPINLTRPLYLRKLRTKITFPEFVIPNIWRGASEIVKTFKVNFGENLSLTSFATQVTPDYCMVVSYRDSNGVTIRYKLWRDVGEIIYLPLYNNEFIGENFTLEVWNTPAGTLHVGGEVFYTSRLLIPTSICALDDLELYDSINIFECTDLTFDLNGFNPSVGDYYSIEYPEAACPIVTLHHLDILDYVLIFCPTDSTWHKFMLVRLVDPVTFEGFTDSFIDPTVEAEPAIGTLPYYPLQTPNGSNYKLQATKIGEDYYMDLNEESPEEGHAVSLFRAPQDGLKYTMRLTNDQLLEISQDGV